MVRGTSGKSRVERVDVNGDGRVVVTERKSGYLNYKQEDVEYECRVRYEWLKGCCCRWSSWVGGVKGEVMDTEGSLGSGGVR